MSKQYPGGIISKTAPVPTQSAASGVWTLDQQAYWQKLGQWPAPPNLISRSLRFNSADSANLSRTFGTPTNANVWTFSCWVKRSVLGGYSTILGRSGNVYPTYQFNATTNTFGVFDSGSQSTTAVFRDPSAWYHLVIQRTNSTTVNVYFNGVSQLTSTSQTNAFNLSGSTYTIGKADAGEYFDGYMTEINFIDGQALTPASFGYTDANTGVWTPYVYTGSYGNNGFYLNFSDNSNTTAATLGKDYSGNGNNWTPNNFSVTAGAGNDSMVDVPTPYGTDTGVGGTVRGNYCTLNPLDKSTAGGVTRNGNLDYAATTTSWDMIRSTFGISSGKWYWEVSVNSSTYGITGISEASVVLQNNYFNSGPCLGYNASNGQKYSGTGGATAYGASWNASNDICGVAFDADGGYLVFYVNGVSQGVAYAGITGTYFPAHTLYDTSTATVNFGQRPFAYTAPSGYKALCTQNLPTPTIGATSATLATKYFNPVLYTGTGASLSVTGVGFQPDWVWGKSRSAATNNNLYDAVRGTGKILISNNTDAEVDVGALGLSAFGSDGFSLGAGSTLNNSGSTYVAWNWRANGSGSTNTAGSITSTVSASTTSGFSVVTFTAPSSGSGTVGHGLGVAPNMMIWKSRSNADSWTTYHTSLGGSSALFLNSTDASFGLTWGTINSTLFTADTSQNCTASRTYVAYCFAAVAGYSAFGSYTGNGSADGPFVYTGFRPAFILYKRSSVGGNLWRVTDSTRSTYNLDNTAFLYPDAANYENEFANDGLDILSNGFKLRVANDPSNASGSTYIYMAFASNPFKYSLAR
jgi:hypothetical protein